ncbi:MAG: hypothetical protein AAGJ52_09420, partial [Pseudomonadota bacterium]
MPRLNDALSALWIGVSLFALVLLSGPARAELELIDDSANGVIETWHLPSVRSDVSRSNSPFDPFSLQRLNLEGGHVVLDTLRPFSLELLEPQTRLQLVLDDHRRDALLALELFDGDRIVGRQTLGYRSIRGSDLAVIENDSVEIRSDEAFDRIELRLMQSRPGNPGVRLTALGLSEADAPRGNAGSLACIIPLGV